MVSNIPSMHNDVMRIRAFSLIICKCLLPLNSYPLKCFCGLSCLHWWCFILSLWPLQLCFPAWNIPFPYDRIPYFLCSSYLCFLASFFCPKLIIYFCVTTTSPPNIHNTSCQPFHEPFLKMNASSNLFLQYPWIFPISKARIRSVKIFKNLSIQVTMITWKETPPLIS